MTHIDSIVGALVEIIHAFASCDVESIPLATKLYVSLLLSEVRNDCTDRLYDGRLVKENDIAGEKFTFS